MSVGQQVRGCIGGGEKPARCAPERERGGGPLQAGTGAAPQRTSVAHAHTPTHTHSRSFADSGRRDTVGAGEEGEGGGADIQTHTNTEVVS